MQRFFFSLFLFVAIAVSAGAQSEHTNEGTDYYVVFPKNYDTTVGLHLYLTTDVHTTTVTILYDVSTVKTVTVSVGAVTVVDLPNTPCNLSTERTVNSIAGIYLHSVDTTPFYVYGISREQASTDAFTAIPAGGLGTDYRVASYDKLENGFFSLPGQVAVIATNDSTTVTFDLPTASPNPTTVTLNRRESYLISDPASVDITGGSVRSNKPIAVFSGHRCANVPKDSGTCDYLVDQLFPTTQWGTLYYVSPFVVRKAGDRCRVIANQDSTKVLVNGATQGIIATGKFLEFTVSAPSEISATKPVEVVQYAKGWAADSVFACDPFMMVHPSVPLYSSGFTFTTPTGADTYSTNWLGLIVPLALKDKILLDNQPVSPTWIPIPNTAGTEQYAATNILIVKGVHTVAYNSTVSGADSYTMLGYVYGWNNYDSYGYIGNFGHLEGAPLALCDLLSVTSQSTNASTCCEELTLKNYFKAGIIYNITADVLTPGVKVRNASGPWPTKPTVTPTTISWSVPPPGLKVGMRDSLFACFNNGTNTTVSLGLNWEDAAGRIVCIDTVTFQCDSSTIDVREPQQTTHDMTLHPCYPDPAAVRTTLSFTLGRNEEHVSLVVTNIFGQEVARPADNRSLASGEYTFTLDAASLPSGIYFFTLRSTGTAITKALSIVR